MRRSRELDSQEEQGVVRGREEQGVVRRRDEEEQGVVRRSRELDSRGGAGSGEEEQG